MLPPHKYSPTVNNKLYSELDVSREGKKFILTLRSNENHTPERIIRLRKEKVNPTVFKEGITSLRTMRDGRVLIEKGARMK